MIFIHLTSPHGKYKFFLNSARIVTLTRKIDDTLTYIELDVVGMENPQCIETPEQILRQIPL